LPSEVPRERLQDIVTNAGVTAMRFRIMREQALHRDATPGVPADGASKKAAAVSAGFIGQE
jgi:hypothetical protein